MTQRIYVISDLHGYYDLLIKLLDKIKFSDNDILYIIGDICDRGPDSLKILFYIQKHQNIILIKGNHEQMMQEALYYGVYYDDLDYPSDACYLWRANGGDMTIKNIRQYLQKDKLHYESYRVVRMLFLKNLYDYLNNLPEYVEVKINDKNYVLVHAGVDVRFPLEKQKSYALLWIRDDFHFSCGDLDKIYIFGHTPTVFLNMNRSFDIWYDEVYQNKIGIDGGLACGVAGQLNCLCLNDGEVTVIYKN